MDAHCAEDRGPLMLAVGWILIGFAILTVATRLYFRSNLRHGINWDDHFVVASLVSCVMVNDAKTADPCIGHWHCRRFFPYQIGSNGGWETRTVPPHWTDLPSP